MAAAFAISPRLWRGGFLDSTVRLGGWALFVVCQAHPEYASESARGGRCVRPESRISRDDEAYPDDEHYQTDKKVVAPQIAHNNTLCATAQDRDPVGFEDPEDVQSWECGKYPKVLAAGNLGPQRTSRLDQALPGWRDVVPAPGYARRGVIGPAALLLHCPYLMAVQRPW